MSDSSSISLLWYTLQRNEFLFPVLMALVISVVVGRPLDWFARRVGRGLSRIGRRPVLSCVLVFVLVVGIRIALLPWVPVPSPQVHDEFSHLLLGDTLAHGRLTNPPSPMWVHFETFHVNMRPTYQSMYLPGQGIFLAIGQAFFGSPFSGVLLSVGLMCAAFLWAFRGWMPPRWAMVGALLTVLQYCSADYWINSYWGGAVAALGGALVLGAYPRLWKRVRKLDAVLLALGLLLLANTRPFEGLVFSIPFGIAVLVWLVRQARSSREVMRGFALPLCAVLALGFAAMMFYFWRSTGDPLQMPYSVNQEQYHPTRPFVWQPLREVHYNHPMMQHVYSEWELKFYGQTRTFSGWFNVAEHNVLGHMSHFLHWLLLPFLVGAVYALRKPRVRVVLIAALAMFAATSLVIWEGTHHYTAPAAAALLLISLRGLRVISTMLRTKRHLGLRFARAYVLVYAALLLSTQVILVRASARHPYSWGAHRAKVIRQLNQLPGKQLVFVRYGANHDLYQDWVYNGYDLENGKVLWAREMADPERNRELMNYYAGRHFWVIEPDRYKAQPAPYPLSPE